MASASEVAAALEKVRTYIAKLEKEIEDLQAEMQAADLETRQRMKLGLYTSLRQEMATLRDTEHQLLKRQAEGPSRELTQKERVDALVRHFAPQLRQRLEALPKKLAKRSGCITSVGAAVEDIGQYFALHGLEAPVRQLFQLMIDMDKVHVGYNDIPKPEERPPIVKLVAAPGMGKTTSLSALWIELFKFMSTNQDVLSSALKAHGSHLQERVLKSLQPHQPLVFTLDLRGDLNELVGKERNLEDRQVLALRMLLSTLYDNATVPQYEELLDTLSQLMLLHALRPMDVLLFVQVAMQLEGQHCMAVFAFDEVNAVKPPASGAPSWVQNALSQFVYLGCAAGRARLEMMPVAIVASTLASATSLKQTASGKSSVAEVQLLPLSYRNMKSVLVDVCQRVGQPWGSSDDLNASVKQVLKFTCGNPRFLAWAIHCMSGHAGWISNQSLRLATEGQEPCPWLRDLRLPVRKILDRLVGNARYTPSVGAWLVDDGKAEVMAQILAHAVMERAVLRSGRIPSFPSMCWQDVENAGFCSLLHKGVSIPISSPAGSPHNSTGGGTGQASSSSNQPQAMSHSDAQALVAGHVEQRMQASDVTTVYAVFVCPLLVIAAMKGLRVGDTQLSVLPMVDILTDFWRVREYTDLTVFFFRLELARLVLGLTQMPLRELLPSGAELPEEFRDVDILVPEPHCGEGYQQVGSFATKEEFVQHCEDCSLSSSFAFIGRGMDKAPDSWLVLQTVAGERVVLFIQSKKREGKCEEVGVQNLEIEAEKCWGKGTQLKRLLVYVTDERTNKVPKVYKAAAGLNVVVVGRSQQDSFYSYAVALTKRCLEWDVQQEKPENQAKRAK